MKPLLALRRRNQNTRKGSVLVLVLVSMALMSFIILFSLRASQQDTFAAHRSVAFLQAKALAEGGLERAKGDVLAQIAATNFLQSTFETVNDKYSAITARFNQTAFKLPATTPNSSINWSDSTIIARSLWNFPTDSTLDIPGVTDWDVQGGAGAFTVPRVYVSRALLDAAGNAVTNSAGSFDVTLTSVAQANIGGAASVTAISSATYYHQLTFPRLFDYLLLGNQLSDCSMCHIKVWGDVGQVRADDPFQMHLAFDVSRFFRSRMWGQMHLNGNFIRNAANAEDGTDSGRRQERFLATPGENNQYIFARNGGTLGNTWRTEGSNSSLPASRNPFRTTDSLLQPLPLSWPSVKDNLLNWFEPRAMAAASTSGPTSSSTLAVDIRDNNISRTFVPVTQGAGIPTSVAIGAGASVYNRAIDRVATGSTITSSGDLIFDRGLHPADDLDGDSIPNGFDADMDGDNVPETARGSTNPSDPAFQLTSSALVSNYSFINPTNGRREWTRGRTWNATTNQMVRASTYRTDNTSIMNDTNRSVAFVPASGGNFRWRAQVTGVATNMENMINNVFANTSGQPAGTVRGVFPSDTRLADGNPDYSANGGSRNLVVLGSQFNPIRVSGQVVVRGDVVITGNVTGNGTVITHRNVFVPNDLIYQSPPDWNNPNDTSGDRLGLVSGANIMIGNILHNTTANTDMMEFIWGNMVDTNSPGVANWNWGQDGTARPTQNHMINPQYLYDGSDGGRWVNGQWRVENAGNTVANVFNSQGMRIGGGLSTTDPLFNTNRRHPNFDGNVNPGTSNDSGSFFRNFYISTPGLLPSGAANITALPPLGTGGFGTYSGGWFSPNDFKFLTLLPRNSSGTPINDIGAEATNNMRWIRDVESVLYADFGVIGGTISGDPGTATQLEFKGTVIGRDIQILAAKQRGSVAQNIYDTDNKFTGTVGSMYYDWRLRGTINPLGFPLTENMFGGEMAMTDMPDATGAPSSDRNNWRPFRLTAQYNNIPF